MKNKIFALLFILWIGLWFFLLARSIFIKGALNSYKILMSKSIEGRRSYVTGGNLYEFLTFCNNNIPESASYRLIGVDDESIERRRAIYYLYPHLEKKTDPDFILIYNRPKTEDTAVKGYSLFIPLDSDRYIMKKKGLL